MRSESEESNREDVFSVGEYLEFTIRQKTNLIWLEVHGRWAAWLNVRHSPFDFDRSLTHSLQTKRHSSGPQCMKWLHCHGHWRRNSTYIYEIAYASTVPFPAEGRDVAQNDVYCKGKHFHLGEKEGRRKRHFVKCLCWRLNPGRLGRVRGSYLRPRGGVTSVRPPWKGCVCRGSYFNWTLTFALQICPCPSHEGIQEE
jgi:hypothetical protein